MKENGAEANLLFVVKVICLPNLSSKRFSQLAQWLELCNVLENRQRCKRSVGMILEKNYAVLMQVEGEMYRKVTTTG
jgi:hypothetical protein